MVTHGGRCPLCQNRTTPGIGSRAGMWICVPCRAVFDNYGRMHQSTPQRAEALAEPAVLAGEQARRDNYWVVPRRPKRGL